MLLNCCEVSPVFILKLNILIKHINNYKKMVDKGKNVVQCVLTSRRMMVTFKVPLGVGRVGSGVKVSGRIVVN